MRKINFKDKDTEINFRYKKELYALINKHGYKYVSNFCHDLYFNKMVTTPYIANLLSLSPQCITKWMKRWRFKLRKTGGKRR